PPPHAARTEPRSAMVSVFTRGNVAYGAESANGFHVSSAFEPAASIRSGAHGLQAGDELRLDDLPHRVPRQIAHRHHRLRDLVAREALLREGAERRLVARAFVPGTGDDAGHDALPPCLVRQADDRDLRDGRVIAQDLLDLEGAQLVSAALEDIYARAA